MSKTLNVSPFDNRQYRHIVLPNKLNVILISDSEITYSAASMSVGVGSYYDPLEFQGLSHFLEHMLFMGSTKYPDENHFSEFVKENGGYDNAYTDNEITNYYFKIQHESFSHALDVFSRFFIDPLMSESSMDREVNAVDSEHSKNITNDHWRKSGVLSYLSHKKSVYHKFGTGNLETLQKNGLNEALHNHHSKYYSSNNMNLVIVGPQSLDELDNFTTTSFSDIPNKNINFLQEIMPSNSQPIAFSHKYNIDELKNTKMTSDRISTALKLIQIVPTKKEHTLTILWELPTYSNKYKYSMLNFISNMIGNEEKGSILATLQENGLATYLSSGVSDSDHFISTFEIDIEVTDKGFDYKHDVLKLVHVYIHMLRLVGLNKDSYDEYKQLSYNGFAFKSKQDEAVEANTASRNMFYYPIEDTFVTSSIMNNYNEDACNLYDEYLNYMQPETSVIIFSSLKYENTLKNIEKWYGAHYSSCEYVNLISSVSEKKNIAFVCDENNACSKSVNSILPLKNKDDMAFNIGLPNKNTYIPTDLEMKHGEEMTIPKQFNCDKIECWYRHINKFGLPKAFVSVLLYDHSMTTSLEEYVSIQLYIQSKLDEINSQTYQAQLAGLGFSVSYADKNKTISISMGGFNHKLTSLLQFILLEFQKGLEKKYHFDSMLEDYQRNVRNILLNAPKSLVYHFLSEAVDKSFHDPIKMLEILDSLQFENVNAFGKATFNMVFDSVKLIVEGNVIESDLGAYINTLDTYKSKTDFVQVDLDMHKNISLHDNLEINKSVMNTEENDSCTLLVYPCGYTKKSVNENWKEIQIGTALSTIIMADKFFDQLRTHEQLGYTTYMSHTFFDSIFNSLSAIIFVIQSNVKDPNYLSDRMINFIHEYFTNSISHFTETEFNKHKDTLIKKLRKPHNNLSSEVNHDFAIIEQGDYVFDSKVQLINRLESYSLYEFITFFSESIVNKTPTKVKVYGNKHMDEYNKLYSTE